MTNKEIKDPIEVNEVQELPDGKMKIIISGILDYSTSEIRDVIEKAFANTKPDPDNR